MRKKNWKKQGYSLVEIAVTLGIIGVLTTVILKQQQNTLRYHKHHKSQMSMLGLRGLLTNMFSKANLCTENLQRIGVLSNVESILGGTAQTTNSGSLLSNQDNRTIEIGESSDSLINKVTARAVSESEMILDFYLKGREDQEGFGLQEYRRSVYINLFKEDGSWACLGQTDASELKGKLENFCVSLGGSREDLMGFDMETGFCSGAVTPTALDTYCKSMEGREYDEATGTCHGVPGTEELTKLCQAMGGTYSVIEAGSSVARECANIPHNNRREELCTSLGGDVHSDGSCTGVPEKVMENYCENGLKGVWGGNECKGALGFKFQDLCEAMGGAYNDATFVCDGMVDRVAIAEKFCNSIAPGSSVGANACDGVQESFLGNMCSGLGGTMQGNSCVGPKGDVLKSFCESMNGQFDSTNNSCAGVFNTFDNFCMDLGGDYDSETRLCNNLKVNVLAKLCMALPDFEFDEEKSTCVRTKGFNCGGGEVLVGSECKSLRAMLEKTPYADDFGGTCPPGEYVIAISNGKIKCASVKKQFYASSGTNTNTKSAPDSNKKLPKIAKFEKLSFKGIEYTLSSIRVSLPGVENTFDIQEGAGGRSSGKIVTTSYYDTGSSKYRDADSKGCDLDDKKDPEKIKVKEGGIRCGEGAVLVGVTESDRKPEGYAQKEDRVSCPDGEDIRVPLLEKVMTGKCRDLVGVTEKGEVAMKSKRHESEEQVSSACNNDRALIGIAAVKSSSGIFGFSSSKKLVNLCAVIIFDEDEKSNACF